MVAARPNTWLKSTPAAAVGQVRAAERIDLLREVYDLAADKLRAAGWADVTLHTRQPRIELLLPMQNPLARQGYFSLRASPTT